MDDVRAKSAKQRRTQAPSTASAGSGDLISGLNDDVLVRILELLPDARDAVTTGLLSRRWRRHGLWTRIPDLRFASDSWPGFRAARDAGQFIAFVDHTLALRAAQTEPAIQNLSISLNLNGMREQDAERIVLPSVSASREWIWYAVMNELKSLDLELHVPMRILKSSVDDGIRSMTLDDLPSSAKLETLRLKLGHTIVEMPSSSAVFASLADLSLECLVVADGNIPLLARLASSACCPHLRKLGLRNIKLSLSNRWHEEVPLINIDAKLLLELSLEKMDDLFNLTLTTPSLQSLVMEDCWDVEDFRISAPNLVTLSLGDCRPDRIYINDEMPGVTSLKVELYSHNIANIDDDDDDDDDDHDDDYYFYFNDNDILLLRNCPSIENLDVGLHVLEIKEQNIDIIKDKIPRLPRVTCLTVHASHLVELHSLGNSIVSLLKQCINLRWLYLHLDYRNLCYRVKRDSIRRLVFSCEDHPDHLESQEIPSLDHLETVGLTGLAGTKCELQLVQLLRSSAPRFRKVTVGFNENLRLLDTRDSSELLPLLGDGGTWAACADAYMSYSWTPHHL